MCVGFWVGLSMFILANLYNFWDIGINIFTIVCYGSITSLSSYLLSCVVNDDGIQISKGDKK